MPPCRQDRSGTTAWPPVLTEGLPLYCYAHESKNEVLCQNVTGLGGLWLVVTPSGDPAARAVQRRCVRASRPNHTRLVLVGGCTPPDNSGMKGVWRIRCC